MFQSIQQQARVAFAEEWQKIVHEDAYEAQTRLALEGLYFADPFKAQKWEQLREDAKGFAEAGETDMLELCWQEADELMQANESEQAAIESYILNRIEAYEEAI